MSSENPYAPPHTSPLDKAASRGNPSRGRIILMGLLALEVAVDVLLMLANLYFEHPENAITSLVKIAVFAILWTLTFRGRKWSRILLGVFSTIGILMGVIFVFNLNLVFGMAFMLFAGIFAWSFLFSADVKALHRKRS